METVVRKIFWNYEKEEQWLNHMAAKGLALKEYTWCKYVFESCKPGQYLYRIELLEEMPSEPKSKAYIEFLEETGVACITAYVRWVYFRKEIKEGEPASFDIYSDVDSRISHYKRIVTLWGILTFINLFFGGLNLRNAVRALETNQTLVPVVLSGFNLLFGCVVLWICLSYIMKIKKLRREKRLRE